MLQSYLCPAGAVLVASLRKISGLLQEAPKWAALLLPTCSALGWQQNHRDAQIPSVGPAKIRHLAGLASRMPNPSIGLRRDPAVHLVLPPVRLGIAIR